MIWISIITGVVLLLDIASKQFAITALSNAGIVEVIPSLLHLQLAYNHGMALGIFSGNSIAVVILPVGVIVLGCIVMKRYILTHYTCLASGLILAGFLGNFIERMMRGFVVDMIYFPFLPFFICNVADIAITAGVVLLSISLLFRPQDWREKHAKDQSSRHSE